MSFYCSPKVYDSEEEDSGEKYSGEENSARENRAEEQWQLLWGEGREDKDKEKKYSARLDISENQLLLGFFLVRLYHYGLLLFQVFDYFLTLFPDLVPAS